MRPSLAHVLLAILVAAQHFAAQPSPSEAWTGGFTINDRWHAVNVRFNATGGTADLVFPHFGGHENVINVAIANLRRGSGELHFEIPVRNGNVSFDGALKGESITGTYTYNDSKGPFGLTRWANVTAADLEKFYGAYRVAPDRVISVFRGWGYARTLNFVDYKTGQVGTLWPLAENEFYAGDGLAVSFPVAHRVRFDRKADGAVTGLVWKPTTDVGFRGRRIDLREERILYKNGDVTIGATLIAPAKDGRHPAIIITPGDYGTNRNQLRMWAHNYAVNGIAALVFDSRGSGESTGPVNSSSFSELAGDVMAGVNALRSRDDINPKQIGLFGFSNSSFTVSLAASRSENVAFVILQSLVGVVPWKQESYRAETQLRVDGFSDADVRKGADLMRLKYEVARTGEGWARLQQTIEQSRGERWLGYTSPPNNLERLRSVYNLVMTYDPVPALEKVRMPVLAMWGDKDTFLPEQISSGAFRRAMRISGNRDWVAKTYPNANHSLLVSKDGSPSTGGTERYFVAGLWKTKIDWLRKRVNVIR